MLKRNHFLSRREVLGTAVGSVFLAPLLRARRLEAQNANPKRLIICFTPDSHPPEWWPTGTGTSFTLNEPLADFRGLESNLLFIQRLDHAWTFDNHHEAGMAQLLTGGRFFNDTQRYSDAPSIDQILLKNSDIRGNTPLASVHVSAGGGGGTDKRHVISYSGPGQPMAHEESASRAFSTVFSGVTFGTQASNLQATDLARQEARRKILQVSTAQLKRIQTYLGQSEREKLELHVEALFECEGRLPPPPGGGTGTGGAGGVASSADGDGPRSARRHGTASIRPLRGAGAGGTRETGGRPEASSGGGRVRSGCGAAATTGSGS